MNKYEEEMKEKIMEQNSMFSFGGWIASLIWMLIIASMLVFTMVMSLIWIFKLALVWLK